ncbi:MULTISPECIES: DUF805 domain-containing protein [unclassified Streptomyces]|uniref:DUF805 domain-containing protein n=1 Tax=unclassified Streptomyces TaxID=2593676 RepID=UPI0019423181|nr:MULTISPECIES: DUF805 domain-containing protein [unclassified Streptomyces]
MEDPINWYLEALRNHLNFRGRARRKEFWQFYLVTMITSFALQVAESSLGAGPYLSTAYGIAALLPCISVIWRRLHDTDRSAWYLLAGVIPLVGWIFLLIYLVSDSKPYSNAYGPAPKPVPAPGYERFEPAR